MGAENRPMIAGVKACTKIGLLLTVLVLFLSPEVLSLSGRIGVSYSFVDSAPVRSELEEQVLGTLREARRRAGEKFPVRHARESVTYRLVEDDDHVYQVFHVGRAAGAPVHRAGTSVIRRSAENGRHELMMVFLRTDPGSFIRVRPAGARSARLDVVLMDREIHHDLRLPRSFEDLLLMDFSDFRRLTADAVRWDLIHPEVSGDDYRAVRETTSALRAEVDRFPERDDSPAAASEAANGAGGEAAWHPDSGLAEPGELDRARVGISDRGVLDDLFPAARGLTFAAWIAEGLLGSRIGEENPVEFHDADGAVDGDHAAARASGDSAARTAVTRLASGLRTIADTVARSTVGGRRGGGGSVGPERLPGVEYVDGAGFSLRDIRYVMYRLALAEPGTLYFGVLSRSLVPDRSAPEQVHVVVLLPHFSDDGTFALTVADARGTVGVVNLYRRYPGSYIHLVRLPATGAFQPVSASY